ncbi:MAG TPA: phytanoyl-CoA dioxygenase family protein [Lacipirellulaceae bacterium]|jgi:non-heme Fe2+,alpha-ketoglutarate-dependent halogenase|nr:phytanoyl-CoA dioxygenase family protein [Lacipirellulaceae bacterium]
MNMSPKVRPAWQRYLLMFGTSVLWAYKTLHLPRFILPRDIKSVVNNWTNEMFWTLIKSRFTEASIDQTCYFKMPSSLKPKAQVAPKFQMSEKDIKTFYTQGFLGPFDAFSHDEMMDFKKEVLALENEKSKTYGWATPRDRHFESPRLWNYMKHPAITERCAQLLGEDLLVWRSQYFYKGPHSPAIQWHQASTFMVEDYQDPGIFPPDRSEVFQLTVWVAIDDATTERGCLRFARGTHNRIRKIKFGGDEGFYKAAYTFDFDEKVEDCVELPVTAGQFIIFTERCIHGSGPNTTDHHRLAFNMRVIPTHVPAYTNKKYYRSVYNGGKYHLDKWGTALLRGQDKIRASRAIPPADLETGVFTRVIPAGEPLPMPARKKAAA